MESVQSRSPLKARPLRLPGQSVQESLVDIVFGRLLVSLWVASVFFFVAVLEWSATVRHWRRIPWVYTALAGVSAAVCAVQFWRSRGPIRQLQLGRAGERAVGEQLEQLRGRGAQVFHDIPGKGFNLDHVLLCRRGVFVIETKTHSKPRRGTAHVTFAGESVRVGGFKPDRDPVGQVQAGARWLTRMLEDSTGKRFSVRGVVVFPGWFVEPMPPAWKQAGLPWVLEPKALPSFIENEPTGLDESDVKLAAYHLSRYVLAEEAERMKRG